MVSKEVKSRHYAIGRQLLVVCFGDGGGDVPVGKVGEYVKRNALDGVKTSRDNTGGHDVMRWALR